MEAAVIEVALGERSYAVRVEPSLTGLGAAVRALGARRVALVTDDVVAPLWAAAAVDALALPVVSVVLPAGEGNKTVSTWSTCVDALLAARVDRRTPVVALGGGVVGDVAGFAAASALRGVPLIQVPTTLLAMVDSSVGGKTGVNHPLGKNLIGAFHQPSLVWAALETLATLPARELRAGLAEVVKAALIADPALLAELEARVDALAAGDVSALAPIVSRCVRIKADVVAADERESGWRAVLNAGHTVGHGLEVTAGFGALLHGEAVAIGLVLETEWAVRVGHCGDRALPDRLRRLLAGLGLPIAPPELPRERVVDAMRLDKKAQGDMLIVPVPASIGQMRLIELPAERLPELMGGS